MWKVLLSMVFLSLLFRLSEMSRLIERTSLTVYLSSVMLLSIY